MQGRGCFKTKLRKRLMAARMTNNYTYKRAGLYVPRLRRVKMMPST